MAVEVEVRRIGGSLGVLFPREEARRLHLKPGKKVRVTVMPVADFGDLRGILKGIDVDMKQVEKELDEGWEGRFPPPPGSLRRARGRRT